MVLLEQIKIDTNTYNQLNSSLQNFLESFYQQIKQQVPILGCVLIAQKNNTKNIIEAIIDEEHKINYNLLTNLELNVSESEIHLNSILSGRLYLIHQSRNCSRYIIYFCNSKKPISSTLLSLKHQQIIKLHNNLLQQYLNLEDKYQEKQNEVENLKHSLRQMAHYLRNHLAEISIITETICLSNTISFCQLQAKNIKNTIINLDSTLKQYFGSPKKTEKSQNTQDIKLILQASINDFKHLIHHKNIKINYPKHTIFLTIDKFKIKQVFDNILSNAIYFSPEGETIDCHWQSFQEEILFSICDRGLGLSPEDRQNMFLPFYSRRENGQGLGLSIVKKIISDFQGNIWAENLYQGGTKIVFVLPKKLK